MSANTTLTIRVTSEVKERLARLATATHRTKSFLAAEAISNYVERETEIVEGIERGIEDMKAGRIIPHDEAVARLEDIIAAAEKANR